MVKNWNLFFFPYKYKYMCLSLMRRWHTVPLLLIKIQYDSEKKKQQQKNKKILSIKWYYEFPIEDIYAMQRNDWWCLPLESEWEWVKTKGNYVSYEWFSASYCVTMWAPHYRNKITKWITIKLNTTEYRVSN